MLDIVGGTDYGLQLSSLGQLLLHHFLLQSFALFAFLSDLEVVSVMISFYEY